MASPSGRGGEGPVGGTAAQHREYSVRAEFEKELLSPCPPCMNVLLFAVGSRDSVAPFVQIAKLLVDYGHRVRLATHDAFRSWIEREANGVFEFFPLADQPGTLVNYMTAHEGRVFPKNWQELQNMLLSIPQNQEMIRRLVSSTLPAATSSAAQTHSDSSDSDDVDEEASSLQYFPS